MGFLVGYPAYALLMGALAYLARHLFHVYRLFRWLTSVKKAPPPNAVGIWGELYRRMNRLQQRNRKRKRKLANHLQRFQRLMAAMPDGTVVLGPEGDIQWFNHAAGRLLGLRLPDDLHQRVANLVRHPAFLAYLAEPEGSEQVEFNWLPDGPVTLYARVIHYGKGQRLLLVRDVSRLYKLEQLRRDFIANVSHELRTPLTVLRGYLETLLDRADDYPESWHRSLYAMNEQGDRMQHIVEDLLLLSRLETDPSTVAPEEAVRIAGVVNAVAQDARSLSGGRHHIEAALDETLWLKGSAEQLRSAFSNLVANAVRYTPDGGRIVVRWFGDESGAHLQVEDNGIGIASQHIPRLTERFYRVDVGRSRSTGGTGLGLAIVKHVLNRHDGTLRVESVLGEGSTFTCDFPPERVEECGAGEESGGEDNVIPLRPPQPRVG